MFLGRTRWVLIQHLRVDDPLEVFLALLRAARTAPDSPEQPGVPFYTVVGPGGRLFALPVFDLGLLLCGQFVISLLDSLRGFGP